MWGETSLVFFAAGFYSPFSLFITVFLRLSLSLAFLVRSIQMSFCVCTSTDWFWGLLCLCSHGNLRFNWLINSQLSCLWLLSNVSMRESERVSEGDSQKFLDSLPHIDKKKLHEQSGLAMKERKKTKGKENERMDEWMIQWMKGSYSNVWMKEWVNEHNKG